MLSEYCHHIPGMPLRRDRAAQWTEDEAADVVLVHLLGDHQFTNVVHLGGGH